MRARITLVFFALCISLCLCFTSCDDNTEHTHEYGEWVEVSPVTCTENGEREQVCSCGDKKQETVNAKGHIFENGRCTVCGYAVHESDGVKILLNNDNTCSVVGINDGITEVVIPEKYNEMPVVSIGDMAFYGKPKLKSVVIPDSITTIGNRAFDGCAELATVTIGGGVTKIGNNAFYGCRKLESVVIPNGVTSIGEAAFNGCTNLKSVKLPESLISIGNASFRYCPALTEIEIPSSVKSIGSDVFMNCTALASITIPDGISAINSRAFYNCKSLTRVVLPSSVTSIGKQAFYECPVKEAAVPAVACTHINNKKLESVQVISGEKIDSGALANCVNLKSVVISEGVKTVEESVFLGCVALESVVLPNSITSIGSLAFSGCVNLQYSEYDNALYLGNSENPNLVLVTVKDTEIESCEINENTKVLAGEAFKGCTKLSSLLIPDGVSYVGRSLFTECKNLTIYSKLAEKPQDWAAGWNGDCLAVWNVSSFGITQDGIKWVVTTDEPSSVSIMGAYGAGESLVIPSYINELAVAKIHAKAFYGCTELKSVEIQDGACEIGKSAFEGCTALEDVVLPDTLTKIGVSAFEGCTALKYGEDENAYYLGNEANNYLAFIMPKENTITTCKINEGTRVIAGGAFKNCTALTNVEIPGGVTVIGTFTFENCKALTSVAIPSGVTTIESNAFSSCPELKSVVIPNTVEIIERDAFYSCLNLTIFCEMPEQPGTWDENWNSGSNTVEWGNEVTD